MLAQLLPAALQPNQVFVLWIIGFSLGTGLLIALVGIVAGTCKEVVTTRAEIALKREMIERGMSAEEIALVLDPKHARGKVDGSVSLSCASEAVVEHGGDWYPALVLEVGQDQYLIHYVGHDMDSNEWVSTDRIRLPAGSPVAELAARLHDSMPARNGTLHRKPSMEAEV